MRPRGTAGSFITTRESHLFTEIHTRHVTVEGLLGPPNWLETASARTERFVFDNRALTLIQT